IFIYSKENEGVSCARNLGIKNAKGEYILFVDGDDWMNKNILSKIYNDLKKNNLEIARFGYVTVFKENDLSESRVLFKNEEPISGMQFVIENEINDFYPWLYGLSNSFLKDNNLLFNSNLSYCEDREFMLKALYYSKKFQNFDYIHYNYRAIRDGSVTTIFSNRHLKDSLNSAILIYEFSNSENKDNYFQAYLKSSSVKTLKKSYYKLTIYSFWDKFWIWNNHLKNNQTFNSMISKDSLAFYILKKSSLVFYLIYYFPRATYHRLNSILK